MPERPRPRGRPEGRAFPNVHSLRLSNRDEERLQGLAEKLELKLADVFRRALRDLAKNEGAE